MAPKVGEHRITLRPGTPKVGVPARDFLHGPLLKRSNIQCPICGEWVTLPATLKREIRELASALGSEETNILLGVRHPSDVSTVNQGRPIEDPAEIAAIREADEKGKAYERSKGQGKP